MSSTTEHGAGAASEASVAELIKQLSEQSSRLARQEVELAKAELAYKGKRAGIGAGMFGGAGVFGFYALGALTAAASTGPGAAVAAWLARPDRRRRAAARSPGSWPCRARTRSRRRPRRYPSRRPRA